MSQRYTYKTETLALDESMDEALRIAARDGWRLVTVVPDLKRGHDARTFIYEKERTGK